MGILFMSQLQNLSWLKGKMLSLERRERMFVILSKSPQIMMTAVENDTILWSGEKSVSKWKGYQEHIYANF